MTTDILAFQYSASIPWSFSLRRLLVLCLLAIAVGAPSAFAQSGVGSADRTSSLGSVGDTELHWAAYRGHPGVVETLLKGGAAVDQRVNRGSTPLHLAAYKGHHQVVSLLIDYGADVNAKTQEGITPLDWARSNEHEKTEALLLSKGAVVGKPLPVKSQTPKSSVASAALSNPGRYLLSGSGQYRERPVRRLPPKPSIDDEVAELPIRQEELDKLESVSQINQMMAKYRDEQAEAPATTEEPGRSEQAEVVAEPADAPPVAVEHAAPQKAELAQEDTVEAYRVQLIALGSSERAEEVRADYARRYAGVLGTASLVVEPPAAGGQAVYRIRSTALDGDDAARICTQLSGRGQPCIVVSPPGSE